MERCVTTTSKMRDIVERFRIGAKINERRLKEYKEYIINNVNNEGIMFYKS